MYRNFKTWEGGHVARRGRQNAVPPKIPFACGRARILRAAFSGGRHARPPKEKLPRFAA